MKLPWKKESKKLTYKFLCRHCDVFFETKNVNERTCPACHRKMELFEVIEPKED